MALVKVNINGKDYQADSGKTILQTIRELEIDHIPTLCHEERLGEITSCFLCVVEVKGSAGLIPSCSTKIAGGMVIKTRSEKVLSARKMCLELLFSDHFADCISPCALKCPAGVDIQGYLSLVRAGFYREAIELIKSRNPLPIVCGRVCVRECEVACRRNLLDQPVAIDYLKRYAGESREGMAFRPKKKEYNGKSVAIIGGGPAGLSAGYYLALEGYRTTIFEAMPSAGGMLRYGIPAYRLPKDLLDAEIKSITDMGVEILCNQKLGRSIELETLRKEYDAVILTLGSWGASGMRLENEDAEGVLPGIDFLRQVAENHITSLKGRVLVVGGGNTAIDACRTSARLRADETVVLYRRTEAQMPAHQEEIDGAKQEGVNFKFLTAPTRIITDEKGRVTGLECIKMELGPPDNSGRPKPIPIENSKYIEPCDWVISAIGQYSDLNLPIFGDGENQIHLNRWGNIDADPDTLRTSLPGVYAGGDVVSGPATAIEGIAGGRRMAYSVHNDLMNGGKPYETREFSIRKDMFREMKREDFACFEHAPRAVMPERDGKTRIHDFDEVELGISREDTISEANRCFQCGCLEVDNCLLRKYGEEYQIDPTHYLGEVNVYDVDRRHPLIIIDRNKCIKCGRCIKTCENILDSSALGFINRGFTSTVAPALDKPLLETNCIACGNCIDSCPTGAISENQPLMARIGEKVEKYRSVCSFCSVGCEICIKKFGRDMRIRSNRDIYTGAGDYLCRRGRFGSRYLGSPDRLNQPILQESGKRTYVDWEMALNTTAERLINIREKHGRNSIAVFISPKFTNEEIYSAVKMAHCALNTAIAGSFTEISSRSHHELDESMGYTVSTNSMDEILDTDVILLVNSDPTETHPSFGQKIREARRRGARIIVINSNRIDPVNHANLWLQPRKGTATHALNAIIGEILRQGRENREFIFDRTEGIGHLINYPELFEMEETGQITGVLPAKMRRTAETISEKNKKIMIVYDFDNFQDRAEGDLQALANLLLITGNLGENSRGLILLRKHSNSTGLIDMGAEPGFLPGRRMLTDESARLHMEKIWKCAIEPESPLTGAEVAELFRTGKIKGALILGEDPLENPSLEKYLRKLEFVAVMDLFNTPTVQSADVILPASTCIESGGSYTSLDRKVQTFHPVNNPITGRTNLQIISRLSHLLGSADSPSDTDRVFQEILKAIPEYNEAFSSTFRGINRFWGCPGKDSWLYSEKFATENGKARLPAIPPHTRTFYRDEFPCNSIDSGYVNWLRNLLSAEY